MAGEDEGIRVDQLVQCSRCEAILSLDVSLTSSTPDVSFRALIFVTMPCTQCGTHALATVRIPDDTGT
jgi:hypothetical protein